MPKYACPICGDPNAYPIWITPEPPVGCAQDWTWHETGALTLESVRDVTQCSWQMGKAKQAADFRKLVPDAFDETGKMIKSELARVLVEFGKAYPGRKVIL